MRLTAHGKRLALLTALAGACASGAGCRRVPYIDQAKVVPRDPGALIAQEDAEVRQAAFMDQPAGAIPLPRVSDPRTTDNPERPEIWGLSLEDAIRIGLDNSEVVRVIPFGAQGIPVGGFEPQFLSVGGAGSAGGATLGAGNLATIYDPAMQETRIANALSTFDANFSTNLLWGRNVNLINSAIAGGVFETGLKNPLVTFQDTATFNAALQKRIATGGVVGIAHNVQYQYMNNPTLAYPSAYTTNLQLTFTQPLLGSAPTPLFPLFGGNNVGPAGIEVNRAPIVIARLNADFTVWNFKAQVMALVRSVEQQYWALAQAQVQYWSAETAVELGEQIVRRERAKFEVGAGSIPNVAEAEEQLERFRLDYVQRTSDLITTERQLRNLLGLPPADNRRIVPTTAPTDARLEPNWQSSLSQMVNFQPDIVLGQLLIRSAELRLLIARNELLPILNFNALYQFNGLGHHLDQAEAVMTGQRINVIDTIIQQQQRAAGLNASPTQMNNFQGWQVGLTFQMPLGMRAPMADVKYAQYTLLQQRAYMQQLVHQTTHQLARFFLEVDANYKLFKTATRLKVAALQRLEAQKAFYEQGTITIDRYLDAVNRWANAVAIEAEFRTKYNISIIAMEETKGTLLAYNNIAVAEGPWPVKAYVQARDQQAAHRQAPIGETGDYHPLPVNGPGMPDPVPPQAPPDIKPESVPPMPAPAGTVGPRPYPASPTTPSGIPPVLMQRPPIGEGAAPEDEVLPASLTGGMPTAPGPDEAPASQPPMEVPLELPTAPPEDLPSLPVSVDAPVSTDPDVPDLPAEGDETMPTLPEPN